MRLFNRYRDLVVYIDTDVSVTLKTVSHTVHFKCACTFRVAVARSVIYAYYIATEVYESQSELLGHFRQQKFGATEMAECCSDLDELAAIYNLL
jgi:hypothetical protein